MFFFGGDGGLSFVDKTTSRRLKLRIVSPISDNLFTPTRRDFNLFQFSQWFTGCSLSIHIGCFVFSPSSEHCTREVNMADTSSRTDASTDGDTDPRDMGSERGQGMQLAAASDSSGRSKDKLDQKTVRRLAQNREAARKSRLRKKAYVQQLENSRLKLTQLEQELQRARQQGVFISSSGDQAHSTGGNGALAFDAEHSRWLEEKNKQMNELRSALNAHAGDAELRIIVDGVMSHYEELFRIKSNAAKNDVFHLLSGMWKTPAERCFLWLGGFRSSELLKLLANQLEPMTERQVMGINSLQQTSQQAEDALSQGMESLQQSLADTLSSGTLGSSSSDNVASYMGQMAMAMGQLGTLEGFIRQADNLRLQTLQQMIRVLTTRQSARAFLAIHDYSSRLRALSSLWLARPRE
ncbi:Transcription factor TGA6 [Raphanus sativus]|nr:Transcription factor TGA6 [Raphanus sativus]